MHNQSVVCCLCAMLPLYEGCGDADASEARLQEGELALAQDKIIAGVSSASHVDQYPAVGKLTYTHTNQTTEYCTGTMIQAFGRIKPTSSESYLVLTAGHCVVPSWGRPRATAIDFELPPNRQHALPAHFQGAVLYAQFSRGAHAADIAVVEVKRVVQQNGKKYDATYMPSYDKLYFDMFESLSLQLPTPVIVAGYGQTERSMYGVLSLGYLMMQASEKNNNFVQLVTLPSFNMQAPTSQCHGDSGGPVYIMQDGMRLQVAVASQVMYSEATHTCSVPNTESLSNPKLYPNMSIYGKLGI